MKLTTAMLVLGMTAGSALAQNPGLIQNTQNTMQAVQKKKEMDSNAALAPAQHSGTQATPSSGSPATGSAPRATTSAAASTKPARKAHAPAVHAAAVKQPSKPTPKKKAAAVAARPAAPKGEVAVHAAPNGDTKDAKKESKPLNLTGRRDPFVSPVVAHNLTGSGCSTGKRCLAIDQIALKGVVRSDNGMIAVVVNAVNKAYFLRENDPVFNGYVVKITGDSIIFKETLQDKLGKPFEREVTKKINTPAV